MINISPTKQARSNNMPDLSEFISTKDAAKKLGFHVKTIPMMLRNKTLDGVKFGRAWLVSKKSVAEYLKRTKDMEKNDPRRKADQ
ncbi:MAG TPA: helix-turn-helix domain-containing protein [Anaerolineales bacterium]|nr:helix-turn-helix domain-containing protein [Anaerolineales bacterium]